MDGIKLLDRYDPAERKVPLLQNRQWGGCQMQGFLTTIMNLRLLQIKFFTMYIVCESDQRLPTPWNLYFSTTRISNTIWHIQLE